MHGKIKGQLEMIDSNHFLLLILSCVHDKINVEYRVRTINGGDYES